MGVGGTLHAALGAGGVSFRSTSPGEQDASLWSSAESAPSLQADTIIKLTNTIVAITTFLRTDSSIFITLGPFVIDGVYTRVEKSMAASPERS